MIAVQSIAVRIFRARAALMNPFFEGLVPTLISSDEPEEKEKLFIVLPAHCVGVSAGLCYKSNNGIKAFTGKECM